MTNLPRLMDVDELAALLPHKASTFYGWRSKQKRGEKVDAPPSQKIGGRVVFLESDVAAWLREHGIDVAAGDAA